MKKSRFPWIETAIVLYCAVQSRDLVLAWRDAPFDRFGYLVLVVWSLPWVVLGLISRLRDQQVTLATWASTVGLAVSFVGSLADLNFLKYWGLAISLAGLMPWSWKYLPWLMSAVSWMPVLGYFGKGLGVGKVLLLRLTLAAAASLWVFLWARRPMKTQSGSLST